MQAGLGELQMKVSALYLIQASHDDGAITKPKKLGSVSRIWAQM
jgi:hypothetical protein